MIGVKQIRASLDLDHPQIFRTIGSVQEEIVGDEREAWLDDAAKRICAEAWDNIRVERNRVLAGCDWTQATDAPVDAKAWAAYRQALRDLPATIKDPTQPVDWPTPPE